MQLQIRVQGAHRLLAGDRVSCAAREAGAFGRVVRQRVRLALSHHLHAVLEPAQEDVRLAQLVAVAAGDQAGEEQPLQRGQGAPRAQVLVLAAVQELQGLHEELHLADPAGAQLEVLLPAPPCLALGPRLERAHLLHCAEIEVLAPDERDQPAQRLFADRQVSGDGQRLDQREPLPGRALRLVVELEGP